jgi:hypothetical protein
MSAIQFLRRDIARSRFITTEDPSLKLDLLMGEKIGAVICSLQAEEAWTPELVREGQEQDEELAEVR